MNPVGPSAISSGRKPLGLARRPFQAGDSLSKNSRVSLVVER